MARSPMQRSLAQRLPPLEEVDPDRLYDEVVGWAADSGLTLYPHQEEALVELLSGNNVVLATPTGSGKSLVATGAVFAQLAGKPAGPQELAQPPAGQGAATGSWEGQPRRSVYTAPVKALVS